MIEGVKGGGFFSHSEVGSGRSVCSSSRSGKLGHEVGARVGMQVLPRTWTCTPTRNYLIRKSQLEPSWGRVEAEVGARVGAELGSFETP